MKKRSVTLIATLIKTITFFAALPISLSAQETAIESTSQAQNKSVLLSDSFVNNAADKATLRELLSEFTTLKASFTQTITDMQGLELQSSIGELVLKKPQQLRWEVSSPEASLLLADGNTVYNVDPFVEQVTLLDQSALTKSNPLMLLITDQETQWAQVSVLQNEKSFSIVSLMPDSPISRLVLNFGDDNKLLSLLSTDRQQQVNSLLFTDVKYDKETIDSDFTFTPESTWVVDDQREQTVSQ